MFLLAHTGITLGVAVVLNCTLTANRHSIEVGNFNNSGEDRSRSYYSNLIRPYRLVSAWFIALARRINIRWLLLGAVLPDIIDKPVGLLLFSSGRIFSHTFLFLILLLVVGLILYRSYKQVWILTMAFGVFIHLILDQMWLNIELLVWPFNGFSFPSENVTSWVVDRLADLIREPVVIIPEVIGAIILYWFVWLLVKNKTILVFLKCGRIK